MSMSMTITTTIPTSTTTTMLVTTYYQSMFVHVSHNMTLGVSLCIIVTTTTIVTEYVRHGGNDLGGMLFISNEWCRLLISRLHSNIH